MKITKQLNLKKSPQLKNLEDIISYATTTLALKKLGLQTTHSPNYLLLIQFRLTRSNEKF